MSQLKVLWFGLFIHVGESLGLVLKGGQFELVVDYLLVQLLNDILDIFQSNPFLLTNNLSSFSLIIIRPFLIQLLLHQPYRLDQVLIPAPLHL